jgi:hypothetical protein
MRENVVRECVGKGGKDSGGSRPRGYVHRLDQVVTFFFFIRVNRSKFRKKLTAKS